MSEFVAETDSEPRIRAWLMPEDPQDDVNDPFVPRESGWRIVIETVDEAVRFEPLRSTWEPNIEEALAHTEDYWVGKPVWRDHRTGAVVNLGKDDTDSD